MVYEHCGNAVWHSSRTGRLRACLAGCDGARVARLVIKTTSHSRMLRSSLILSSLVDAMSVSARPPSPSVSPRNEIDEISSFSQLLNTTRNFAPRSGQPSTCGGRYMHHGQDRRLQQPSPQRLYQPQDGFSLRNSTPNRPLDPHRLGFGGGEVGGSSHPSRSASRRSTAHPDTHEHRGELRVRSPGTTSDPRNVEF